MQIRQTDSDDIPLLERSVKAALGRTFQQELEEQQEGVHSLLIAIEANNILGWSFIRWLGPRNQEASTLFPDAPEIYRLEVRDEHRSKGIGSRIIAAGELAASSRAYPAVSLGVAHDNPRAYALYQRLGYENTQLDAYYDDYEYPLPDGSIGRARDLCRFLVKSLTR